jgi:hypothetical protein
MKSPIEEIAAERRRQIEVEGWTSEHDDRHERGELAKAAAAYAYNAGADELNRRWNSATPVIVWPWSREWWKPTTSRRDLIKAAALIVAEIERLDRAEKGVHS